MATPPAPLPPEVAAQQSPEGAQSAFAANGIGQPQPGMEAVGMIQQKIQQIAGQLDDLVGLLNQVHPPLKAYLAPVAKGLMELRAQTQQLAQRSGMAQGSPVMPQPVEPNPAAGPPQQLPQA